MCTAYFVPNGGKCPKNDNLEKLSGSKLQGGALLLMYYIKPFIYKVGNITINITGYFDRYSDLIHMVGYSKSHHD